MSKTKKGKSEEKLDALIFIDTNVLLDFYRIRNSDASMNYLNEIEIHQDKIITSSQVEMEFKKNRQKALLESIIEVNKIRNVCTSVPIVLLNSESLKDIESAKARIINNQKILIEEIEDILKYPEEKDPVYKSLQKLFKSNSQLNLNRENEDRFRIREAAQKRFTLGYPPRKNSDSSIGDAVNWEWVIHCAKETKKSIIIVTRDTDFGCKYGNDMFLNDWLLQEFKERTGKKRKIVLTNKLSKAFQLVEIDVTEEMILEENQIITERDELLIKKLNDLWSNNLYKSDIKNLNSIKHIFNQNIEFESAAKLAMENAMTLDQFETGLNTINKLKQVDKQIKDALKANDILKKHGL